MTFEVEKGVKKSDCRNGDPYKKVSMFASWPFDSMDVGDSFFVPSKNKSDARRMGYKVADGIAWTRRQDHLRDKKFSSKASYENGVWGRRVWRDK